MKETKKDEIKNVSTSLLKKDEALKIGKELYLKTRDDIYSCQRPLVKIGTERYNGDTLAQTMPVVTMLKRQMLMKSRPISLFMD